MTVKKDLLEKRLNVWEQAKALNDDVGKREDPAFTAEEQETWDRLNAELDAIDARVKQLDEFEARSAQADEARRVLDGLGTPKDEGRQKPRSDAAELRDWLLGRSERDRGTFELDLSTVGMSTRADGRREFRGLTAGTASAGGDTVPTTLAREIYIALAATAAIRQTNARIIRTESGEKLRTPKVDSKGAAVAVNEAAQIAGTDPTFTKLDLDAFKYGQVLHVSRELLEDTGVEDLESILGNIIGENVGEKCGTDYVTGNGSSKPLGVMAAAATGVTGGTGVSGAFTADNLIDLYFSVIAKHRANGYWFMRDATMGSVRKLKDGQNQYLWTPGLVVDAPDTLLSRPVVTDPNVAAVALSAKSVAFGNFSAYWIRDVKGLRIERSEHFKFDTDEISFKAVLRTDGDLIDTNAVKVFVGGAS